MSPSSPRANPRAARFVAVAWVVGLASLALGAYGMTGAWSEELAVLPLVLGADLLVLALVHGRALR